MRSKYGDQSSAFMVLMEQAKGGVGHNPKPIVGDTLHTEKCQDYTENPSISTAIFSNSSCTLVDTKIILNLGLQL